MWECLCNFVEAVEKWRKCVLLKLSTNNTIRHQVRTIQEREDLVQVLTPNFQLTTTIDGDNA